MPFQIEMVKLFSNKISVLIGASNKLVGARELRNKYCTNRQIKTWAFYFLLKSLSSSGQIQHWIKQREFLLEFLKCNEQTFRSRINELVKLGLVEIAPGYTLILTSYKNAASILEIEYLGTTQINYDYTQPGKNLFSYSITAEEILNNQDTQRTALTYHLEKNQLLLNLLSHALIHEGCDARKLNNDPQYFQESLLKLQEASFKQGSDNYTEVMQRRADVNRGVKKIAKDHNYKSIRSVTYLKRALEKLGLIKVVKRFIVSDVRSRRYVPAEAGKQQPKSGYMWLKTAQTTCWQLCDQLIVNLKIFQQNEKKQARLAVAA